MEYFPSGTLDLYMTTDLREVDAQSISLQLLEGLKIIHEEGFTHRDLKPQVNAIHPLLSAFSSLVSDERSACALNLMIYL